MAALPPQPPGTLPPQPPSVSPPSGPPQSPYPGASFTPSPYPAQPVASAPVKVHKRTFFLTLAQIIIIVRAILVILLALAIAGLGIWVIASGRAVLEQVPFYDQARRQAGEAFFNGAVIAFAFIPAFILLVTGVIDLILGVMVGRPSNIARWFIVVLDVLSLIYVIDALTHSDGGIWTLILLGFLIAKVIVLYAMLLDPATRRNFAGKAY